MDLPKLIRLPMNWKMTSRLCGLAPMLDEVDALPGPERKLPGNDRHLQRDTIEHRLDMSRHVVGPFDIVNPRCVLRCQPIERGDKVGLDVGIGVFLDRQRSRRVTQIDQQRRLPRRPPE